MQETTLDEPVYVTFVSKLYIGYNIKFTFQPFLILCKWRDLKSISLKTFHVVLPFVPWGKGADTLRDCTLLYTKIL